MRRPLFLAWYWCLRFKLAGDEVFGVRQSPGLVEDSRRLHRELFGPQPLEGSE
jgi:hypothetical protein